MSLMTYDSTQIYLFSNVLRLAFDWYMGNTRQIDECEVRSVGRCHLQADELVTDAYVSPSYFILS